eukprot:gnl/TRDRNA2_/TRDRNA2_41864_c0_seq1.p1 gnl/TRDRNA2_/TRDRNA2_41864_c0~~gnl/TRDRNA2_/TRDRNA2_41864_c0_seq1.p1  ORF type:complete len:209 (+),score=35.73 gnl/TRDRNA2_/TRDRNA2_41864_c0_seq1:66-692(+)
MAFCRIAGAGRAALISDVSRLRGFRLGGSAYSGLHLSFPSASSQICARACASGSSDSSGSQSAGGGSSDERFEKTGEYDTQDKYKRVGNPIAWANPTGGGTIEDKSSNKWTYVFPLGIALIGAICLISRSRNQAAKKEESLIEAPRVSMPDTSRFKSPAYQPPPEPSYGHGEEDVPPPPQFEFASLGGGGISFSPPPDSGSFSSPPSS